MSAVARLSQCAAVALSATMSPARPVLGEQLATLVNRVGVPVFVGGAASMRDRDAIVTAGAEVVGTDIAAGVQRIRSALAGVQATTG